MEYLLDPIFKTLNGLFGINAYWEWKKIIHYMQILKDNKKVIDNDCTFKKLFKEWDSFILADKYAYVKYNDQHHMVKYKTKGNEYKKHTLQITIQKKEQIDGILTFGMGETEDVWRDDREIEVSVNEKNIFKGIFKPADELCSSIDDISEYINNIKMDKKNERIKNETDYYVMLKNYFIQQARYPSYFFEKIKFYMKVYNLEVRHQPALKF